jgi:hypothetical protein
MNSASKFRTFLAETAALLRADAGLYLAIAVYALVGLSVLHVAGAVDRAAYAIYVNRGLIMFGIIMPFIALAVDVSWSIHRFDRRRGLVFSRVFSPTRLAHFAAGLCLMQAMTIFFGTFTSLKNAFPLFHGGFPYDTLHADIDATLHGGVDPWRLIQPLWGSDLMRFVVEWNYNVLWFILCYGALFFIVTSPRARHIRARYVLSFMLVWILVGNLLAGWFLSAGPAFYGFVTGDAVRFAEQLEFLARSAGASNSAASYQTYLWSAQEAGLTGLGTGISAFPSVHVALISLNAFFLYAYSRRLGIAAFVYVAFVLVSSVYLAWHYAIDGYVAIALAALVYFGLAKWLPGLARNRRKRENSLGEPALTAS